IYINNFSGSQQKCIVSYNKIFICKPGNIMYAILLINEGFSWFRFEGRGVRQGGGWMRNKVFLFIFIGRRMIPFFYFLLFTWYFIPVTLYFFITFCIKSFVFCFLLVVRCWLGSAH